MVRTSEIDSGTDLPEIKLSRFFPVPRALVFKAWSTTEHVRRWFCPETYTIPEAEVALHIGGPFDICMRSPEGIDHWIRGRFTDIVPLERLAIEMEVTDAAAHALFGAHTFVTFAVEAGGTRMEVVQTYTLHDPACLWMLQGASSGWDQTLNHLAAELTRMQTGTEPVVRSVVHATFHLQRVYEASPARIWKAFTDETAKARWFSGPPDQWELLERRMDARAGGRERLRGRWKSGVVSTFDAVYHDVIPNERLVYSYEMHLDGKKISVSLATVEFRKDGEGTKLLLTEQGAFLDGYDDAGSRERGAGSLLDRLGSSLRD
ncbi:MAG TPA: SRPBCC family protein [Acetobacteraceae bacterium]|nr:SRPBCC family protein [Acetobacteraceae bacterium]